MPKSIDDMTYTQLLNVCERRPMWAVDKILKLSERAKLCEASTRELAEIVVTAVECLDLLKTADENNNLDFMCDHAEG